ncbi:hypothetical protein VHEMI01706 [[Torrubiella] hemipterigena]|uniref:Oxidoreductase, short chain dehydrogenase/reductase family n=1 Tax=[Torrubiella] hemipterigena TaxID=1531966 RepID=A0A0A1STT5_9HYPO|nr:hypothetical protein VHEMI01706 [[Torrubiella] hemipterigena]
MSSKPFAIIAGVGAGTGAAVAKKFAKEYPVALLARSEQFADSLAAEINAEGGSAVSYKADVSDETSIEAAMNQIRIAFGTKCAAAVFNASSRPFPKPFSWQSPYDLRHGLDISLIGAFLFAKATLPLLLNMADDDEIVPTLIFTGATASVKANAWLQPFNIPKHALRGLAQTLYDEFKPKGVHVAHVIIDGVIRMPLTWWLKPFSSWHAKLDPNAIAQSYWLLHKQHIPHLSQEICIRPFSEKW